MPEEKSLNSMTTKIVFAILITLMLSVGGWALATIVQDNSRLTILETKQVYTEQLLQDIKDAQEEIKATQSRIEQTQQFLEQNLHTNK